MGSPTSAVRERYAQLRKTYEAHPETAMIHKSAHTVPADGSDPFHPVVVPDNVAAPSRPYRASWRTGIDQAVGGLHDAPNPGEMLCGALAACFDGTLRMIAAQLGVELQEVSVTASADVDVRGALAIAPDVRVGLEAMRLAARVETAPGTPETVTRALMQAAERYCITLDTLRAGVPVTLSIDAKPGEAAPATA